MKYKSNEACVCCGECREYYVAEHHIYTRKSHPEHAEKSWNKIPVCATHHVEAHKFGNQHMAEKYRGYKKWLEENGWEMCELRKRWSHSHGQNLS